MLVGHVAWRSRAPEGFEAAEWQRFDTLCDGLEGVLELPIVYGAVP